VDVELREPRPGDLGWIVQRNAELYAAEYGWDAGYEALVARIVADFAASRSPSQRAWIAELDGQRVGCVLCVRAADAAAAAAAAGDAADDATAQLRLLLVDPAARGLGVGRLLVDACVEFARAAGYSRMTLWTQQNLTAARRLYAAAGFELIESAPHHSFGVDLVEETWALDL
jgi:GNAT superfamily N-acetyltransferase